jgi:hypothetical protein
MGMAYFICARQDTRYGTEYAAGLQRGASYYDLFDETCFHPQRTGWSTPNVEEHHW